MVLSLFDCPSSSKLLKRLLCPLTENSSPLELENASACALTTPGISSVAVSKPLLNGRRAICCESNTVVTWESLVSSKAEAEAFTCTCSAVEFMVIAILPISVVAPELTKTFSTFALLNPAAEITSSYFPIGTARRENAPSDCVVETRLTPLDNSVAVMRACATTAPEPSVTMPEIVPVVMPCPRISRRQTTAMSTQHKDMRRRNPFNNCILPSTPFLARVGSE